MAGLYGWVVLAGLTGRIELAYGFFKRWRVDLQTFREFRNGIGFDFSDLANAVFVTQHSYCFLIEYLNSRALRLGHDFTPEAHISEVAVVLPFIDKALAIHIDDDAKRIGVFLVIIQHFTVTVWRRADIPADGMTTGPVPR